MSALDWTDVIAEQSLRRRRPYPEEATIADLVNLGWSEGRARGYMARRLRAGTAAWEWALDDDGKKVKAYRQLSRPPAAASSLPSLPGATGGDAHPGGPGRGGVRGVRAPKGRK